MVFIPKLIISGGQTGADQGALIAAKSLGIPTGGFAPKGWKTELGPNFELGFLYGLKEHKSASYPPRTRANVEVSNATIIFGRTSAGSNLTARFCAQLAKLHLWVINPADETEQLRLQHWLRDFTPSILNCAGNRESKFPGIQLAVEYCLLRVLEGKL